MSILMPTARIVVKVVPPADLIVSKNAHNTPCLKTDTFINTTMIFKLNTYIILNKNTLRSTV
jgi:hypothetical protein